MITKKEEMIANDEKEQITVLLKCLLSELRGIAESKTLAEKELLTISEAAAQFGIGEKKLRHISEKVDCDFVLRNGRKCMIKREKLRKYIDRTTRI